PRFARNSPQLPPSEPIPMSPSSVDRHGGRSFALRNRVATAAFLLLASAPARAEYVINLTSAGSSGTSQGALYEQADPQPTGTGVINPFVRIQRTGTERGYNTDGRPVEFDTKDQNQWTHSLPLSSLSAE